jgi:hypothetical protein
MYSKAIKPQRTITPNETKIFIVFFFMLPLLSLGIGFRLGNIFTLATFIPGPRKHHPRIHEFAPFFG